MQCPSCRAVYSNGLNLCPRCKTPAQKPSAETRSAEQQPEHVVQEAAANRTAIPPEASITEQNSAAAPPASTLIEFPGVSRNRPQWRKDLSERVREIQERRAREAANEAVMVAQRPAEQPAAATPQLGLVPQPDAPAVNPIVAAALKRLERARQPPPPVTRSHATRGGAATAVARVAEEQYRADEKREPEVMAGTAPAPQLRAEPQLKAEALKAEPMKEERPAEVLRERTLVVVPTVPSPGASAITARVEAQAASLKSQPEATFEPSEEELATTEEAATVEPYDDRAPVVSRVAGSLIDLLVVAFASSPFAAIIELTNGNWADIRVAASMGGIVLTIMFLYLAASTALTGRTWGMSLLSIRAVDADSGLPPTTKQAVGRALLYMLSLAALGIGILYALFDAEGRTVHDHLSSTAVVRE